MHRAVIFAIAQLSCSSSIFSAVPVLLHENNSEQNQHPFSNMSGVPLHSFRKIITASVPANVFNVSQKQRNTTKKVTQKF